MKIQWKLTCENRSGNLRMPSGGILTVSPGSEHELWLSSSDAETLSNSAGIHLDALEPVVEVEPEVVEVEPKAKPKKRGKDE